jgi:hypothetical protein
MITRVRRRPLSLPLAVLLAGAGTLLSIWTIATAIKAVLNVC